MDDTILTEFLLESNFQGIREKELAEMYLGGLSEGWSLTMVHIIPIVTVSATTMACMVTNKYIVSANVILHICINKFRYFYFDYIIEALYLQYIPCLVLILINLKHCIRNSWLAMSSISRGVTSLNKLKV